MIKNYLLEILDNTQESKIVKESKPSLVPVLMIEGKEKNVIEKKSPNGILKANITNSLQLLKERISHLSKDQQAELIKDWESKRKLTKLKKERSLKELGDVNNLIKETVIKVLPALIKFDKKSHTIVVKSPFKNRSYKFTYQLKPYGK